MTTFLQLSNYINNNNKYKTNNNLLISTPNKINQIF